MKWLVVFLLMLPAASAEIAMGVTEDHVREEFAALSSVPIISNLFGNERMNVHIEGIGNFSLITERAEVVHAANTTITDPTMNITVTEDTFSALTSGELSLVEALDSDAIEVTPISWQNQVKVGVTRTIMRVVSWFR